MTQSSRQNRIVSVDIMRGIIMLLMVIDHVRGTFTEVGLWLFGNVSLLVGEVTSPIATPPFLFMLRWITHLCAPSFVFLAGVSIYFWHNKYGKNKSVFQHFILRGLLLIFIDLCINGRELIGQSGFVYMGVMYAIGMSMIIFPFLINFSQKFLLILAIAITLLCNIPNLIDMLSSNDILNAFIFKGQIDLFSTQDLTIFIGYPVLPWFAVMLFGFSFAHIFTLKSSPLRLKILFLTSISFLIAFVLLRTSGIFGDSLHFSSNATLWQSFASFINITKYPPSLQYLLFTLGIMFLLLALIENFEINSKFLLVFGTTPLFFYCLHLFYIKATAVILKKISPALPALGEFSFSPTGVIVYSILLILILYPSCIIFKNFMKSKKI